MFVLSKTAGVIFLYLRKMSPQLFIFEGLVHVSKSGYSVNPSRGRIFFKMVIILWIGQPQPTMLESRKNCARVEKFNYLLLYYFNCYCQSFNSGGGTGAISPFHYHCKLFHNSQLVQVPFRFWWTNSVLNHCKVPKHFDYIVACNL